MNVKKQIPLLLAFLISLTSAAQFKGQLRGIAVEQLIQQPLAGATVTLSPLKRTAITDAEGLFRFSDLPVGNYTVSISYAGFKEVVLENIQVNSGKETVLHIPMEAVIKAETEVVLQVNSKKNKPLNEMNAVSARAFTVEETQKYAAAVNDPLRMAVAFPGVMAGDDGNNSIIIRGNSPVGLLWRMEGLDIPNPNHFALPGNSGGGISILSAQLLANSDFVTAAFAAEYGNAISGVFDLHLRKGNNEKREYTLQAGVLGLNAAIEGPFSKKYKGSYLVNYRYSTLSLLTKLGVIDNNGITNFQDLSYNIHLPAGKAGSFTLFGFNGRSDQLYDADKDSSKWEDRSDRYSFNFFSHASMNGMTHTIKGNKWNLKTGIGLSGTRTGFKEHMFMDDLSEVPTWLDKYNTRKWVLNSTLNYKFSRQLLLRAGIIGTLIKYTVNQSRPDHEGEPLKQRVNTAGNSSMQQAFAQAQFRPSEKITLQAGMHYLRVAHNNSTAAEPRASVKWTINKRSGLAFGYGLHSQAQTWGLYFVQQEQPDGSIVLPNKNLGLTRAHHYVLSYNYRLAPNLQLRTELYYQYLFNVPVSVYDSSTLSALNIEYNYLSDPMINKGRGRNQGLEISIERYLHNNFYLTLTNSLYQSKYKALDGIERNTRFNGNHISTLIAGKDFVNERKSKTIGLHIKTIYAGGLRNTPIDAVASAAAGYAVYYEKQAFSLKNPDYFRTDIRASIKWNRRRVTSTLSLDIQNVSNRQNIFGQGWDKDKNKIVTYYQMGLLPILNYKIEF